MVPNRSKPSAPTKSFIPFLAASVAPALALGALALFSPEGRPIESEPSLAPAEPTDPDPPDGAEDVSIFTQLAWGDDPSTGVLRIVTDAAWRASDVLEAGWETVGFDDSAWEAAAVAAEGCPGDLGSSFSPDALGIWSANGPAGGTVFLRGTFQLPAAATIVAARVEIGADDDFLLFVNGALAASDLDGAAGPAQSIDLAPWLQPGANVLAVEARDAGGDCRAARLEASIELAGGTVYDVLLGDSLASAFDYPDFDSIAGLNLEGVAFQFNNRLRLTSNGVGADAGAAWREEKVFVADGFETTFQFQITGPINTGADGIAFVVQNDAVDALGLAGGGIGYSGIANSLAVEFDTWLNPAGDLEPPGADPDDNHLSVHTGGVDPNSASHAFSIGSTSAIPNLSDGQIHTARIAYDPGSLSVFIDNLTTPALTVAIDLSSTLDLDFGRAWVGLTAAKANGREIHDILNWSFLGAGEDNFTVVCEDLTEPLCDPGRLDPLTDYFWRVRVRSFAGEETLGPIWSFRTGRPNSPPELAPIADRTANPFEVFVVPIVAVDLDGDGLTLAADGLPGFASLEDFGDGTGQITFSPGALDGGLHGPICVTATDDGEPPLADIECFSVEIFDTSATLGGRVLYYAGAAAPVSGATLEVSAGSTPIAAAETDGAGVYATTPIPTGEDYQVTPTRGEHPGDAAAISAFDAALMLQSAADIIELSPRQRIAADVNGDGAVAHLDAALALELTIDLVGLPFPGAPGVWAFDPPQREYLPLLGDAIDQDYAGILIGDASGDWTPAGGGMKGAAGVNAAPGNRPGTRLIVDRVRARPGQRVVVQIVGERLNGAIGFTDLRIAYDPAVVRVGDATRVRTGASLAGFTLVASVDDAIGQVRLSAAGPSPMATDGPILLVEFEVVATRPGSHSAIRAVGGRIQAFDGATIEAERRDGDVRTIGPPLRATPGSIPPSPFGLRRTSRVTRAGDGRPRPGAWR